MPGEGTKSSINQKKQRFVERFEAARSIKRILISSVSTCKIVTESMKE
jgi:hypothetical protein